MANERNTNSFWKNVLSGVAVAAAGAAVAYVASQVIGSSEEAVAPERPRNTTATKKTVKKKSEELRQSIEDQLNSGTYGCVICLEEVTNQSEISSCKHCFTIYHLNCLKTYINQRRSDWRTPNCPTCRNNIPYNLVYTCFCKKKVKPELNPGLTPHSCGLLCNQEGCMLLCHPGPCQ